MHEFPALSQKRQLAADVGEADLLEGVENRADAVGLRAQLAALLVALPKEEADPLLLFALAELSYQEVAEALELPMPIANLDIGHG